jgi:AcrR family transcriptional regulator
MRSDARRNRERVLVAAEDVFSEMGLRAQIEEVARRAGVGVGTVCRHFPTKQALVEAVLEAMYESLLQDALRALEQRDPGPRSTRSFAPEFQAATVRSPAWLPDRLPSPQSVRDSLVRRSTAARAQKRGIRPTSVRPTSRLFSGVAHATALAGDLQPVLRRGTSLFSGFGPRGSFPASIDSSLRDRDEASSMTAPTDLAAAELLDPPDPRRWITLTIVIISAFIVVLDNTVLNVAIPTILREFHTTLPSLEWVVTGYALTFATFLIIGGRLGDVYGHRRVFVIGALVRGRFAARPRLAFGRDVDPRRSADRGIGRR